MTDSKNEAGLISESEVRSFAAKYHEAFFKDKKDRELCILKIESDEELQTVVKAFWILFQIDRKIRLEENYLR